MAEHRAILVDVARRSMIDRGLRPDFPPQALAELERIHAPDAAPGEQVRDLRSLLWSSIDNDDSRDLDQLAVAQQLDDGMVKILVAIADVDSLVRPGSALDEHARHNTTSVYTPAVIFSMLPEKLSTDLTSLNFNEDRLAVIAEMVIAPDGSLHHEDVYEALVRNHARLSYNQVAAWLDGAVSLPNAVAAVPGLEDNLRLQDRAAVTMKHFRHFNGALTLETIETRPLFENGLMRGLEIVSKTRANLIIENFMIAANGVTARFLSARGFASIRRVVAAPQRWDRIVELAQERGTRLPGSPNSVALEEFLVKEKIAHPKNFADLSLAVIKLIGAGEYQAELPSDKIPDHFGLAAHDYTHSTAPNRRYPDLITQRQIKAALAGLPSPYSLEQLTALARHCTLQEDAATKVERQVNKSAAALLFRDRIGETFDALVTGASPKGTWVRLLSIPVEGRLIAGEHGLDVGHHLRVRLAAVDVERGFIDFSRVKPTKRK
jgi:VacB/RNase II family 3'-5' exoribonuclease